MYYFACGTFGVDELKCTQYGSMEFHHKPVVHSVASNHHNVESNHHNVMPTHRCCLMRIASQLRKLRQDTASTQTHTSFWHTEH